MIKKNKNSRSKLQSQAIIVIGMHRSGTSALSGELSRLGVFMGKHLLKPQKGVNDKGFYENARLLKLNEQLLDRVHLSWDHPLLPPTLPESISETFKRRAIRFVRQEYESASLWGMKDPRVSMLLPFWHQVFLASAIEPVYVLMIRHPLEVAASLQKRDGFSRDKGLMLWLNYNFFSYLYSLQSRRVIIDFESLLDNPNAMIRPLMEQLAITPVNDSDNCFIDRSLKRQLSADSNAKGILANMAMDLYRAINRNDRHEVECLFKQYQVFQSSLHPVLKEHLRQVKADEVHFRNRFESLYDSLTWQLIRPLKKLESLLTSKQF
ncbi:sulfotransferase family protein [Thalassotalea mangrovi]|uniref:Sulfotransferase family protein n=1 Tax=Thalassotalea mangrovi TaxID=2572245 RepID=A0A4U1BAK6_9GAMM|nr:hypothetical protein [Thalassotalea mangrovi]TKB47445.1 hypothetical protein E8M12_01260 [Thalassotalea mangrovi]